MKHLFLLLFAAPLFTQAQDCSLKKTKDQFTQEPKLSSGFLSLGKARVNMDADSKEINFLFVLDKGEESFCFDDKSTAMIILDDGRSKINYRNSGTMNCEGYFQFNFRNSAATTSALQRLTTNKVKTIRFTHNKVNTDFNLTEEQKQLFMDLAACMAKEAKTLIK